MSFHRTLAVLLRNPEFQEQSAAFTTHLILNLSLFIIVLGASITLSATEFAQFSLANSYVIVGATLIDLGINGAAMKLAIEEDERRYVQANFLFKGGLLFVCLIALSLLATLGAVGPAAVILICAAGMAFWYSLRCIEQYDRRFKRFAITNLALASMRLLLGGAALLTHNWLLTLLAVHVAAVLMLCAASASDWLRIAGASRELVRHQIVLRLLSMAPPFFFMGALFSLIPAAVQTAIFLTGSAEATGAFGIVALLTGGISLMTNTLRVYLQPQIIQKPFAEAEAFGLGRGSLHIIVAAYAITLLLGLLPISVLFHHFYHSKFPDIGLFILLYGSASCIADSIGIYNMRCLRGRLIWIGLKANALRAALIFATLLTPQFGALAIVIWSSAILVLGEIILFVVLAFAIHEKPASAL